MYACTLKLPRHARCPIAALGIQQQGWLPSLLELLEIRQSSQLLVFSKTSLQLTKISPRRPRALYFNDEAHVGSVQHGNISKFAAEFQALGPHDRQGRSLREFDLERRMFKYPCSFLICGDAFAALPTKVRTYVDRRLEEILSGSDKSAEFAHLSPADRTAIREILNETLPRFELPTGDID